MKKLIFGLLLAFSMLGFASDTTEDACAEPQVEVEKVMEFCAVEGDATADAPEKAIKTCFEVRVKTTSTEAEDGEAESVEDCEETEPSEQTNPV